MQQPHLEEVSVYADITEVRQETRIAECKKLLENGWVLLAPYPRLAALALYPGLVGLIPCCRQELCRS